MGQTLPPSNSRYQFSYATLVRGVMDATKGQYRCDRIEVSPDVMSLFIAKLAEVYAFPFTESPTVTCVYCRRKDVIDRCESCGAPAEARLNRAGATRRPLMFMSAEIVYGHNLKSNEMRFINTRCPDYSGRLLLDM